MKSTFWRSLFGDEWFTDELGDANEKDELMKLHRFWCLEWSEFETVYKRKDISSLKKFMTSTIDAFRTPYSRSVKEYPRRCILVGTTNEKEILSDPTGSRRFWIIPVTGYIPVELLDEERDRIWATAYALYKAGEKWWLTAEEATLQEERNEEFQSIDPWVDPVGDFLHNKDLVSIPEVFDVLGVETDRREKGLTGRVAAILRQLGWDRVRKYLNGRWRWLWSKLEKIKVENSGGSRGSVGSSFSDAINDTKKEIDTHLDPPLDPPGGSSGGSSDNDAISTLAENSTLNSIPLDPPENPNFLNFELEKTDELKTVTPATENGRTVCPATGGYMPQPLIFNEQGIFGVSTVLISPVRILKKGGIRFQFDWEFADGSTKTTRDNYSGNKQGIEAIARKKIAEWQNAALLNQNNRYRVRELGDSGYTWAEGATMTAIPNPPLDTWYRFSTPDMRVIRVAGLEDFELMGTYAE